MSKFIVGLTGGIGSGKTTVSDLFAEHFNITIVDADVIARQVVEPGTQALQAIAEYFGNDVLTAKGELDRSQLRQQVFDNEKKKQWLNQLLHPIIRTEMIQQCQQANSPYAILSIPLLVENQLQSLCHRILVVDCSETLQIQRASHRDGVGEEQIKRIMQAQVTRTERVAAADDVILNDSTAEQLSKKVSELHKSYLELSEAHIPEQKD